MKKHYTLTVTIHDPDIGDSAEELSRFQARLQLAFDKEWPYAPMGSVEITSVKPTREPSESELIGPLG